MAEPSPHLDQAGWNRREFVQAGALLALALGIPAAALRLGELDPGSAPSAAQRALFREVSQLVLPRTDTPGAGDVGTGDFVLLALAHRLAGSGKPVSPVVARQFPSLVDADGVLRHADWLALELDRRAGGDFMRLAAARRAQVLAALDAEAFRAEDHPWCTIKALVLTGYYTSQPGGAQELRYEPVPGRWDADLPQTAATRAISNDWTAVDFG